MKKLIILLIMIAGINYSCSDYLDFQPKTLLTPEAALNSEEDVIFALNGVYSSLQKAGYYGTEFVVIADAATDNGNWPADRESAGTNQDRLPFAYSLDLNSNNTATNFWTDGYITIASVNNILKRLEEVSFDESFEDRVTAECLAIRAMTHFDLTRIFAQDYNFTTDQSHYAVPYMFESVPGSAPGRNTMADVYQFAMIDIDQAITLLRDLDGSEVSNYRGGDDIFFINYYSALGVRARMNFYKGDYEKALIDSDDILDGPYSLSTYTTVQQIPLDFTLPTTFLDEWYRIAPVVEEEAIFQLEVDEDDGDFANRSFIDIYLANDGNAAHGASAALLALFEPADLRNYWFVDEPATPAPDRHVYKYPGSLGINADAHAIQIMRLSEFVLMSAECEARTGSQSRAQTLLNNITARANASPVTSTGNQLIEDIITERRKELSFEGHRLFDLKRLQRGFTRGVDCKLTNGNCSVTYPTHLYAWPIPVNEINANQVIREQQNPGY